MMLSCSLHITVRSALSSRSGVSGACRAGQKIAFTKAIWRTSFLPGRSIKPSWVVVLMARVLDTPDPAVLLMSRPLPSREFWFTCLLHISEAGALFTMTRARRIPARESQFSIALSGCVSQIRRAPISVGLTCLHVRQYISKFPD